MKKVFIGTSLLFRFACAVPQPFDEFDKLAIEAGQPSREQMLKEYHEGNRKTVTFPARVYIHGKNKNHTQLNEAELEQFATSFAGKPFLKDHAQEQDARGGTILQSKLVERDGKKLILQTIKAVKPWAVEGYLDGTIDRFSIGWSAEKYICTVDGEDIFECSHGPFAVGKPDKKTGEVVEVLMKGLDGMETSTVTHPAVSGTGTDEVLSVLCQLSETRASGKSGTKSAAAERFTQEESKMKEKVLSILGLPADTGEPEALNALEKRIKAPPVPTGLIEALGLPEGATENQAIAKICAMVPKEQAEALQQKVNESRADELVRQGKAERKITPAMEERMKARARRDPDSFAELLADLPVQGPDLTAEPPKLEPVANDDGELPEIAQKLGVHPKVYAEVVAQERRQAAREGR